MVPETNMVQQGPIQLTLPHDLADIVRNRLASGRFSTVEEVLRTALALMNAEEAGDNAAAIHKKIDEGWEEARSSSLIDGAALMKQWRSREERPSDSSE
jgi:putative addiction module CopG family antidote